MELLWAVAILLVLAGLAGTILPALPGAPLVFAGLLIAAWIDHFQKVGWFILTLLFLLMLPGSTCRGATGNRPARSGSAPG
ncbi:MAG: DUF456 family protein, partial [Thermoanaerobaculia bacterium]